MRHDFDLWPDCDLDLGCRNLNHVRDTPSHYVLSFCEVSLNLLQQFLSYYWDTILISDMTVTLILGVET